MNFTALRTFISCMSWRQVARRPTAGTHRTINYVVCSSTRRLWADSDTEGPGDEASPHRAVRIAMVAKPKIYLIEGMSTAKQLTKTRPMGCARKPVAPKWHVRDFEACDPAEIGSFNSEAHGHGTPAVSSETWWQLLIHAMATEV